MIRLIVLAGLSVTFLQPGFTQIVEAERFLWSCMPSARVDLALDEEQKEATRQVRAELSGLKSLHAQYAIDHAGYMVALVEQFQSFSSILNEQQQAIFEEKWRELQQIVLARELEATCPGLELSEARVGLLVDQMLFEECLFFEQLSAAGIQAIFSEEQQALYQTYLDGQERRLEITRFEQDLKRRQQDQEITIDISHAIIRHYLIPLRQLRNEIDMGLSETDQLALAQIRADLRQQLQPHINVLRRHALFVYERALLIEPTIYSLEHFLHPTHHNEYVTELSIDPSYQEILADIVERNRALLFDQEGVIKAIAEKCREVFLWIAMYNSTIIRKGDDLAEQYLFPDDSLSPAFLATFLLMEPIDLNASNATYPSPFIGNVRPLQLDMIDSARIMIHLPNASNIHLEVHAEFHSQWREFIIAGPLAAGDHEFSIDLSNFQDGNYVYVLTLDEDMQYEWPLVVE